MSSVALDDEDDEEDEEEDDYLPKTLAEAVDAFMCLDISDRDSEIIEECTKKNIDKILPDFEPDIRTVCGFDSGNKKLLEACGDEKMNSRDASRIIMLAIWDYFHFTQ